MSLPASMRLLAQHLPPLLIVSAIASPTVHTCFVVSPHSSFGVIKVTSIPTTNRSSKLEAWFLKDSMESVFLISRTISRSCAQRVIADIVASVVADHPQTAPTADSHTATATSGEAMGHA